MKRFLFSAMLIVLLCISATMAQAEALPTEIADWFAENGYSAPQEHLLFDMPDGSRQAFVISDEGWSLYGFICQNGEWKNHSSGSAMEGYTDIHLMRHTAQQQRPDGMPYGDGLGFDIVSDSGTYLSYHYDGEFISICGWFDPNRYNGKVMVHGTSLEYYPTGSTTPEMVADAGDIMVLYG